MDVTLRITVVDPPEGVLIRLQKGKSGAHQLEPPAREGNGEVSFDFVVRAEGSVAGGAPRFLGPYVQGPPESRHVYVSSGTCAGQASCWSRRAKVHLRDLSWLLVERAARRTGTVLEVRYPGTGKDGGPSCASVDQSGWTLVAS